jgi:sugar lactone lactonase YvrE
LETLAFGYGLAEGPRVDADGNVYFTDVLGGGVHRWSPDGSVEVVVPKRRGIGGLLLHADCGVVVSGRDVSHVKDGETRTLLALEGVTGFNDMTTDMHGRVYAGTLRFNPFQGESPMPGEVWRIDAEGEAVELFGGIDWANGIGFSPDAGTIYISDYADGSSRTSSTRRARPPTVVSSPSRRRVMRTVSRWTSRERCGSRSDRAVESGASSRTARSTACWTYPPRSCRASASAAKTCATST